MAIQIQDFIKAKDRPTAFKTEALIAELYLRGVKIGDIFGRYFEFDVHATVNSEPMVTVADALREMTGNIKLKEKELIDDGRD